MDKDDRGFTRFDSPLEDYPGCVRFPRVLTAGMYRHFYREVVVAAKETDEDPPGIGIVIGEGEDKTAVFFSFAKWRVTRELGEVRLENLPAGALEEPADDVPVVVLSWVCACFDAWIDPQLGLKKLPTPSAAM